MRRKRKGRAARSSRNRPKLSQYTAASMEKRRQPSTAMLIMPESKRSSRVSTSLTKREAVLPSPRPVKKAAGRRLSLAAMACRILLVTAWPKMVISVSLIPSDRPLRAVRIKYSRPQKRRRELSAFPSARASMALCSTSGGRMLRKRERKMVPERAAVSAG